MTKRKTSAKAKIKRGARRAKRAVKRAGRKAKPIAKKAGRGVRKLGRKAGRLAKSDPGRAGIGAGVGALALGPIGAVAGAAVGLATRDKREGNPVGVFPRVNVARQIFQMERDLRHKDPEAAFRIRKKHEEAFHFLERKVSSKTQIPRTHPMYAPITSLYSDLSRRSNPEPKIKVASVMGSMLLDYHRASPAIESVSAASLRGERVPLSHIERARHDLQSLKNLQTQRAEKEQIADLIDALDRLSQKARRSSMRHNPARAFSLDAQVKQIRQSKAKKGAMGMASRSSVYGEVKSKSLASKLRKINPGSMLDDLAADYRKSRKRWLKLSNKPDSESSQIERAKKRMDEAEDKLILYAQARNLSSEDLKTYMKETQSRKKNPRHLKLHSIPSHAREQKIRETIGRNIAKLSEGRDPRTGKQYQQKQAVAIALTKAREDAKNRPTLKRALTRMYGKVSNPLEHIPKGAGLSKIRSVVSDNISTEMAAGKPQQQAVAIAISMARADASRVGGETAKLIRAEYPSPNPKRKRGRPRKV